VLGAQDWIRSLEAAIALDWPYLRLRKNTDGWMPPAPSATPAAVLVPIAFAPSPGGVEPFLLLTVRTQHVETHKGQISFPGGLLDESETHEQGALRELTEELGVSSKGVRILGRLPELPTLTSGFQITPVVGVFEQPKEAVVITPHDAEVAQWFWAPLSELERVKKMETYRVGEVDYPTPVFYWEGHRIWGATAAVIWNLLERLDKGES
jgi:8-oxo-dGTP pyrophosphatase MutT (NUDIX family)